MYKTLLLFLLISAISYSQHGIDVLDYNMTIAVNDSTDNIVVEEIITLKKKN